MTPKSESWVDLTEDELNNLYNEHHALGGCWTDGFAYEQAVIAKFKEKNTPKVLAQGELAGYFATDADGFLYQLETKRGLALYKAPPSVDPRLTLTCPICAGTLMESVDAQIEAAIEATKEKAAKVCEEIVIENGGKTARNKTSFECAAAIRSMK